jgi:hypothetical protein
LTPAPAGRGGSSPEADRIRRGKLGIIAIVGGTLVLGAAMMAVMRYELRARLASPGPSFEQYVSEHHLGTVSDLTDGTATDPSTTILTLYEAVPNDQLQRTALDYMRLFVQYDQGQSFILQEPGPAGTVEQVALAHYDPGSGRLTLDLRPPGGAPVHLELQAPW